MTSPDTLTSLDEKAQDLRARITALDADRKPVREQLGNLDRTHSKLSAQLAEIERQIGVAKKAPRVSDHAVLRYLERVYGFDFEDVRQSLLTDTVIAAMQSGVGKVKVNGGKLIIKEKTVVTFAADDVPKRKREKVAL